MKLKLSTLGAVSALLISNPVMSVVGIVSAGALSACSSDDPSDPGQTKSPQLPQGQFLLGVSLAPFSGLVLPYRMDVDGGDVELRAVASTGEVSGLLAQASDVAPAEDGSFEIDLGTFVQPGAYTPTKSDVEVQLVVSGKVERDDFMCGTIEGNIITFGTDLAGSTFGAEPFSAGGTAPSSCEGAQADIPRIEQCPTVTAGKNTGFPSGRPAGLRGRGAQQLRREQELPAGVRLPRLRGHPQQHAEPGRLRRASER